MKSLLLYTMLALLLCLSCTSPFRAQKLVREAPAAPQTNDSNSLPAPAQSLTAIPFEQSDNLIYLQVQVNNSAPLQFVLDSGASVFVIGQSQAKTLNLKTEEKDKLAGAGAGTFDVTYTKNVTFGLPGVNLLVPNVALTDLSQLSAGLGRRVDGIVGFEFFDRHVVEIDYDANVIRLFDPKSYNYSGSGEVIPITIKRKHAFVAAKIKVAGRDSVNREYLIDTGASGMVSDPLVAQSTAPKMEFVGGIGLGNEAKIVLGRVERLQLGSFVFENTNGVAGAGPMIIAGELLRRFTVIFDYSRQRMILEPSRHFRDGFIFDTLGAELNLEQELKGFGVDSVFNNSVAAEAGLKKGDLITTIDGQPALSFSLPQVRRMFEEEKEYRLGVKRGSEMLQVKVKLRKLL